MFAHGETVVVLRGDTVDDPYSNEPATGLSWDSPAETPVAGCAVAPRYANEGLDPFRPGVIVGLAVYMPAGTDVTARDRLRVRGEVYEVDGEPALWRNPFTGWAPGIEVAVKRLGG